ncbi:MAG: PEGA domain-containing protein [Kofleriaceae bacterium]|nr:PEGA domain-containing protein [Kofleriaceae bacterium]
MIFAVVTLMGGSETEQPTNAALPSALPLEYDPLMQPVPDKGIVEALDASGPTQAVPNVESKTVVLVIDSDPSGAKVYRESDGVRLGQTPYKYTVKRGTGHAGFLLKKSGYHRAEFEMPITHDGSTTVELIRRGKSQSGRTPDVPEDKTTPERTEGDKLPTTEPEDDKTRTRRLNCQQGKTMLWILLLPKYQPLRKLPSPQVKKANDENHQCSDGLSRPTPRSPNGGSRA